MTHSFALDLNLRSIFWPKEEDTWLKKVFLVAAGVVLLALASKLSIPFKPVPLTFQSTAVILIGMAYGARYGAYVVTAYFMAGIFGFPVFADMPYGIAKFFGPTGGYLLGYLPAVMFVGYLTQKGWGKGVASSFAAAALGDVIIFLLGVSVLSIFTGWENAITFGVLPFIISEPIKLAVVALIAPRFWKNDKNEI